MLGSLFVRAWRLCVFVCVRAWACVREWAWGRERHTQHRSRVWIGRQARLGRLLCGWAAWSPPCTCTGPASCWPTWCSWLIPDDCAGGLGGALPQFRLHLNIRWQRRGLMELKKKKKEYLNCQGIWAGAHNTQCFFSPLPVYYMPLWLFSFLPTDFVIKDHPQFLTILSLW